jgi:hypothetical protein
MEAYPVKNIIPYLSIRRKPGSLSTISSSADESIDSRSSKGAEKANDVQVQPIGNPAGQKNAPPEESASLFSDSDIEDDHRENKNKAMQKQKPKPQTEAVHQRKESEPIQNII